MERGFFAHVDPEGRSPADRVGWGHRRLVGTAGENIANIDAADVDTGSVGARFVRMWMESPGHRRNLLGAQWNAIGVGVARRGTAWMATQVFADVQAYLVADAPVEVVAAPRFEFRAVRGAPMKWDVAADLRGPAVGELAAGEYLLRAHFADAAVAGRVVVYPGPRFRVVAR